MRGVLFRSLAVLGIGLAVLFAILYYASTVDGRPPAVQRIGLTHHVDGEERVGLTTTSIEVEFSEPVRTGSAEAAFQIDPAVGGSFTWTGSTLTFTPAERLPLETDFQVAVVAGVEDAAGNRMPQPADPFEFRTVGPPTVSASQPQDGSEDVALDAQIVITFSTLMDTLSVEEAVSLTPRTPVEASWSGEELVLTPIDQLEAGQVYRVTISTEARDGAGIALGSPYEFSFRTARSALSALTLIPSDGVEGISVRTPIAVMLDRAIDPDTATDDLLSIEPEVPGTLRLTAPPGAAGMVDPTVRLLLFQPAAPLEPNTTYRVTLAPGLGASDGVQMSEPISWSFTTGAPVTTLSNQIVFISDRAGPANLWAMNPDGSVQRQVSVELSAVTDFAVAPDGRGLVIGDGAVLIRQEADGGQRTVLTPAGSLDFDPAWAPDGSQLAFARADAETGAGEGIWLLGAEGGEATRLELPAELPRPGTATPSPDDEDPAPLLRTPRFSPDGAALAYVDAAGWVAVVELPAGRLTRTPFRAVGAPAWMSDSSGLLVAGVVDDVPTSGRPPASVPIAPLDPDMPGAARVPLSSLGIAQLDRGAASARELDLDPGASRPAVREGLLLYVALVTDAPAASGELWLVDARGGGPRRLLDDGGAAVLSASFGIEPRSVVAARLGDGIWRVDGLSGRGDRLSGDGWQARWLP